jgi:hypothetical protein
MITPVLVLVAGGVHLELVPRRDVVVTASDRLQRSVDAEPDSKETKFDV